MSQPITYKKATRRPHDGDDLLDQARRMKTSKVGRRIARGSTTAFGNGPTPATTGGIAVRVWIDQDLCTGDGICAEIAPALFDMDDDGLAYVKERDWPNRLGPTGAGDGPRLRMAEGTAAVPDDLLDAAVEAAEECPGECIFFDPD